LAEKYTCIDLPVGTVVGVGVTENEVEPYNQGMKGVVG